MLRGKRMSDFGAADTVAPVVRPQDENYRAHPGEPVLPRCPDSR